MSANKGQAWFTDLLIGTIIFAIALVAYIRVSSNISDTDERQLEELRLESEFIGSSLSGKGYPSPWDSGSVQKLGITNGERVIMDSKVQETSKIEYSTLKVLLGTRNDFYAHFQDPNGNVISINGTCGIGKLNITNITAETCNNATVNAKYLVQSERLLYRNGLTKMIVYVWREK